MPDKVETEPELTRIRRDVVQTVVIEVGLLSSEKFSGTKEQKKSSLIARRTGNKA